ncbi:hypothetical protein FDP41_002466 [Naegleria fowleri]|uniref:Uncharacterized protein n=1 Tax=Naegleria fowleri TaxID=5763 RepID=A0A6A5BTV3_NAEFO|nr:uncharacterized protein FDP41_002466 [Naegleria fowleri]KAF0978646.1 hypothetical protein FDP41_002466 [Naegleria fowleri]
MTLRSKLLQRASSAASSSASSSSNKNITASSKQKSISHHDENASTTLMMDDDSQQQQVDHSQRNQFSEALKANAPAIYSVFEQVLKRRDVNNGNWKSMNIIIEAITETIYTQQQPLSPTSYYGAILKTLSSDHNNDARKVSSLLQLLSILMEHIKSSVVLSSFEFIGQTLLSIHQQMDKFEYVTIQLVVVIIQVISKLGTLPEHASAYSKKQDLEKLSFSFLFDSRNAVREKCLHTLQQLIEKKQLFISQDEMVSVYLIEQYHSSSKSRNADISTSVIKAIGLLSENLNERNVVIVLQKLLDILLKGNTGNLPASICAEIYRTMKNIFDSNKNLQAKSVAQIIDILLDKLCPILKSDDPKKVVAYIVMMTHAHKCLYRLDKQLLANRIPKFFKLIFDSLLIGKPELDETVNAAFSNLQNLIFTCFDLELFRDENQQPSDMEDNEGDSTNQSSMVVIANTLQNGLENVKSNRYDLIAQLSLDIILKVSLLRSKGLKLNSIKNCISDFLLFSSDVLQELLRKEKESKLDATPLEQSELKNARSVYYLEKIVGYCIRALGPEESFKEGAIDFDGWVLSILINHKVDYSHIPNLKSSTQGNEPSNEQISQDLSKLTGICVNGQLGYWINVLLPMAKTFYDKSKTSEVDRHGSNAFLTLYEKIWALLPQFCSYPVDLDSQFASVAPLLGEKIASEATKGIEHDIKIACCNSLSLAISTYSSVVDNDGKLPLNIFGLDKETCKRGLKAIAGFNKQFIPLLFNLFVDQNANATTSDLQYAVGKAITAFFSICDNETITEYFKLVLKKILTINSESDEEKFFGFFDLSITMLSCVPNSCLELYYKFLLPYLKITSSTTPKLQKKAYKGLNILLSSWKRHSGEMKAETIDEILSIFESIAEITISKKFRVKCFNLLVTKYHDLLIQNQRSNFVIGECIFNIDNTENQKVRDLSIQTLKAFIDPLTDETKYSPQQQQHNVIDFIVRRVLPGLCGKSDSMIASTIDALSELLPSYSKYLQPILKDVFDSVTIVLQDENVKVVSSLMQFFKRCVALFEKETLKPYISQYLDTFFNHSNEKSGGTSLRVQLRFLVTKLLKKFSYEELKEMLNTKERQHFLKNTFKNMQKLKKNKKNGKGQDMEDEDDTEQTNQQEEEEGDNKKPKDESTFAVKRGKLVIEDLPEGASSQSEKTSSSADKDNEGTNAASRPERTIDLIKQSINNRGASKKKQSDQLNPDQLFLAKLEKRKQKKESKIIFGGGRGGKNSSGMDPYAYIPLDPKRLNKRERNKESNFQKFERITKKKK